LSGERPTDPTRTPLWRRRWAIATAAVAVVVGVVLALTVFEFQTLFIDQTVDERSPLFEPAMPDDVLPEDTAAEMREAMAERPLTDEASDPDPMPQPQTIHRGTFMSRSHPTSGTALVIGDGGERRVLRFEDFRTDNGPALNVYLSTAAPDSPKNELVRDFVDLGPLKGNVGAQNYEVPAEVDLGRYRTVVVWCVRFAVAFGTAGLD
jgi:hypothetical protein